jgi:anaerobic magnesium-protoporphyrin IX monomethyl ester cyclase
MKVLLINPTNSVDINSNFVINIFQPLGIAYLAGILKKNKIKVKIIDALAEGFETETIIGNRKVTGLKYETIKKKVHKFNPQIVGITTPFSFQAHEAYQIAKIIKCVNKKIIVVAGGTHATIQPQEMLNDKNIDYVIRGEGEYSFLDFVKKIENKKSIKNVKGLSYLDKNLKLINNPKNNPITNLDELAFPTRNLLPMKKYFAASKKGRVIESLLLFGKKRTSIITSRGCPFTCTFCSVNLIMTRCWRSRSPKNVVKEIKYCVNKYHIKYFDILDDNFTLDPNRAKEICRLIIKQKINVKWSTPNGIRADRVDDELIYLMKKAGCIQVKVAPESGNKKILSNVIKKNLDLKKVEEAVEICKRNKLSIEAFFVIGFPEETEKNIYDTINYAKKLRQLGCDFCYFFIATPYKGTEMYNNAVTNGYLDVNNYDLNKISTTDNTYLFKNTKVSQKRLFELQKIANSINPPITKIRFLAGIRMLIIDPIRIVKFALSYTNNLFTSLTNHKEL